jgi:hypothetical protein
MARLPTSRSPRTVTSAAFRTLTQKIEKCESEVERLNREVEVHIKRMAAMQAELDHLRAMIRS